MTAGWFPDEVQPPHGGWRPRRRSLFGVLVNFWLRRWTR